MSAYQFHTERHATGCKITASKGGSALSQLDFYQNLANTEFSLSFSKALTDLPYSAIFWETPALSKQTSELAFECMAIHAPALESVKADPNTFAKHFARTTNSQLIRFNNLSGQSTLIAPLPIGDSEYSHLLAFLRTAPSANISAIWQTLSESVTQALASDQPFWVSTSGLGVYWLHLRIDPAPKYYRHQPYKIQCI